MEDWRKWCKERKLWTRSKAFHVGVDVMAHCSFSIDFYDFVLLLLLNHSSKLAIPNDNMFLLLKILQLFLFKSLQIQGELRISEDIRVVFWWARDGNSRLSFLRRADRPFFRNGFVAIYFWPSFSKSCLPRAATMRRRLRRYRRQVNNFRDIGMCHWPHRWCTM